MEEQVMLIQEDQDGGATVELPKDLIPEAGEAAPVAEISNEEDEDEAAQRAEIEANGEVDPEAEAIRQAKRDKRKSRKEYHKKVQAEKDTRLQLLQRQNQELLTRLAEVERKTQGHDIARIDAAMTDQQARITFAQQKMKEAIETGNGDLHAKATELYYEARRTVESLENLKKQATISSSPPPTAPNQAVQRLAADWLSDNPWYDPSGQDEDSEIAMTIDKKMVKEGWNPASAEYWEELDNRLQKYLPHRYNDSIDENPKSRPKTVVTGSGRESVTNSGGRANTFTLSPDRVRAMKDAGMWDDPEKRARMIKRYALEDRNRK
jgi:hypothetical protein